MKTYVLYGFGILLCVSGLVYLSIEYIRYLSEFGKLGALFLSVGLFASLGKYFQGKGW
ncbi:MAG: hypothetical protein J7L90_01050 [Dehalococcoidia bacterium]|nr:hypothetical protein [Dehalococcoidia bacterium]